MENPFPPLQTEDDDKQDAPHRSLRGIPLRAMFPNLITLLAIASGLTAIRFAVEARVELSIAAIILAGFLDGIDGRVARLLKSTSKFGAQMDSLADFVNFGVAPALLIYFTMLNEMRSIGWIAVIIYAICVCMRLARFNAMLEDKSKPAWQKNYFQGIPSPAGAIIVMLPVYGMVLELYVPGPGINFITAAYTLFIGLLMVSNLPTFSGKDLSAIPRDWVFPVLIFCVAMIAFLLTYPWSTLIVISVLYLCSIPFSMRSWNREARQDNSMSSKDTE